MAKSTKSKNSKTAVVLNPQIEKSVSNKAKQKPKKAAAEIVYDDVVESGAPSESQELDTENAHEEGDAEPISGELEDLSPVPAGDEATDQNLDALVTVPQGEVKSAQLDLLKQYIKEISKYPLLNPEEELEFAIKLVQTGDVDAAKKLVTANLRLVVKIAMEYRNAYQNVMDLIQEGNVGLMKAVSKYDPTKGAKLSYYASWWIRSYILKYILDNFRLIRVGTTQAQKKLFFHLVREKERLEAQGIEAGPKLLADRLHVREKDVVEMSQRLSGAGAEMSLNTPVKSEDEGSKTHIDLLKDGAELQDEILSNQELREVLREHLDEFSKTLKEKELAIFKERLAAEDPKTLQEVADLFGLTRERARQIETRVIEKLRLFYKEYLR